MSAPSARSQSLLRWMLEEPGDRLVKGLILPLALFAAFVALLVIPMGGASDVVYFDPTLPKPDRFFSRSEFERQRKPGTIQRRTKITYWEKWAGFEGQAIQDTVDAFNRRQDRIYVQLTVQGDISQKTRIATAGGDPPDLAGLYSPDVPVFAEQNALLPLDDRMREAGIKPADFVTAYLDLCVYRGKTWAFPTTPSTWALHWNKKLFREAGLDPDRPPRTIAELDAFAAKLTKKGKDGHYTQVGYLPTEPGWWKYPWCYWFGGGLWNGKDKLTANSPENIKAMEWIRSYVDNYGAAELDRFKKTFGAFSSSDNAFFTGKVAMEIQGVWMAKFVKFYAPAGFEYGVAPFPSAIPGLENVSVAEADVLGIPAGAKHIEEAFEFMKFMATPDGMEILCLGQGKHSPLRKTSANWYREHPNPYVRVFEMLAASPNCRAIPPIGIWREYGQAWGRAFDDIWTQKKDVRTALDDLQAQMQKRMDHELWRMGTLGVRPGGEP